MIEFAAPDLLASANNPPLLVEKFSTNTSKTKKPRREPPSDYSRSGGSRGCPGQSIPLTVLAPRTFVGGTTSLRPTFTWFMSKAQKTELRLFHLDTTSPSAQPKRIGSLIKHNSVSGINKLSLPENQPALTIGEKYILQLSIDCPGGNFIQSAEFRVLQKTSLLKNKLSKVANNYQKANIYAKQDLWYEALEEALKNAPPGKLGQMGSSIVQRLVQSDNFIPEQLTLDRREILKKEIQQQKNHLGKISERN